MRICAKSIRLRASKRWRLMQVTAVEIRQLQQKARDSEAAAEMERLLSSPDPQPPK
jgi:hypothetical protein